MNLLCSWAVNVTYYSSIKEAKIEPFSRSKMNLSHAQEIDSGTFQHFKIKLIEHTCHIYIRVPRPSPPLPPLTVPSLPYSG